ncbi:carbohydrate ABC transporter permease [Leifsonia shinshuensis]|uniref:Multiple sugar transport system permease protein/sn-glycerol 3-phosphate transport system permease protein n=1 Tax=Leifsonia shinshuensis TaxID=150026 RepID=A0A853CPE2_9MICO|nr:carbohydrate ABC transporter permease [Leifsonia shinshuensis]NYJ22527.1 multiple sugar transport system permease protein/sn-glycerol 3-phosphate transport system permease protein [Leifsonia shinshuensis]
MSAVGTVTRTEPSRSRPAQSRPRSRRRRLRAADLPRLLALVVLALLIAFPIYLTFVSGFFRTGAFVRSGLFPPPADFTLDNFTAALTAIPLGQQYLTSIVVMVLQTLGQLVTSALAAYALVFPKWRGRGIAFALVIATLAIPGESLVVPNYQLVSSLGLRDTVFGIIIPYLAFGYPIFLLRQAFASLPREIWEASRLDGCGDLRTLLLVVLPACRSQVTTAIMWSALFAWNGFFWPLLITDSPVNRTVQVGLSQLVSSESTAPATIFAGTALVLLPTVILVIVSQRFLLSGMSRGVLR